MKPSRRLGRTELLEREAELGALDQVLEAARAGTGNLVIVEAGPGMGKSALLAAAGDMAQGRGMTALWAAGRQLERDFPFGVALQLFEPVLAGKEDGLLSGAAALASPLFSGQAVAAPASSAGYSLIHGLYWLVGNLCWTGPEGGRPVSLALVIDDAQWADASSLHFLVYLVRRLEDLPVAVVISRRWREADGPEDLLAELALEPSVVTVRPGPLSPGAVAELVGKTLPDRADESFCRACIGATQGNPFLLRELLAEVAAQGGRPSTETAQHVEGLAPEAVLRAVVARMARLPAAARALASAVAVLGSASLTVAAKLAELYPLTAAGAADALAEIDILAPGQPLSFVHPLVRSAVYADLGSMARGQAHRRAARLLDQAEAPVEQVAAHLMEAPGDADAWVVERLRQAAASAIQLGTPGVAARLLARALAEPPAASERYAVLRELARAESAAGVSGAGEHLSEALSLASDPTERARTLRSLGRVLYSQGHHRRAAAAFEQARGEIDDPASPLARDLDALWAGASILLPELAEAAQARLHNLASDPGGADQRGAASILAVLAVQAALTGEPAERARQLAMQAMDAGAGPRGGLLDEGLMVSALSLALVTIDDLDLAEHVAAVAIEDARSRGSVTAFASASYLRAWPLYLQGRLVEAIADVEGALDTRRFGVAMHAASGCAVLARARMERGDLEGAQAAIDLGPELAMESQTERAVLLLARGELLLARQDPEGALADLEASGALVPRATVGIPLSWRAPAASAALALGRRDRAGVLVQEEREAAERLGTARARGTALRVAGLVAGESEGLGLLEEAVEVLEASPSRLELVRALVDHGAALRRAGHRSEARNRLQAGLDLAHRLGALALASRAHDELLASGARPRRAALVGRDSLTPSEHRVAQLAAQGRTNREIAQALFVTMKAVEAHLAHAYPKLGITSRKELAGALEE